MQTSPCLTRVRSVTAWFLFLTAALIGAGPTGSISGRIQNVVTGQYLNNVRVSVKGTDQVAFTDQSGSYRLAGVPGGQVVLEVFYTGLDAQEVRLTVAPGQSVERDV